MKPFRSRRLRARMKSLRILELPSAEGSSGRSAPLVFIRLSRRVRRTEEDRLTVLRATQASPTTGSPISSFYTPPQPGRILRIRHARPGSSPYDGLLEEERDELFMREAALWLGKRSLTFSPRTAKMLRKARGMADEAGAKYDEWIGAQYDKYRLNLMPSHLASRYAAAIYRKFKEGRKMLPHPPSPFSR